MTMGFEEVLFIYIHQYIVDFKIIYGVILSKKYYIYCCFYDNYLIILDIIMLLKNISNIFCSKELIRTKSNY